MGFLFPSFLPSLSSRSYTQGGPQCFGGGRQGIMLICFLPLLLMVQHKKHLFSQTLIIHNHFQRDIRRVCVGGIQKRMCCIFLSLLFTNLLFKDCDGNRQNSFHPIINYSWKTMNSSSACLSHSGRERRH